MVSFPQASKMAVAREARLGCSFGALLCFVKLRLREKFKQRACPKWHL